MADATTKTAPTREQQEKLVKQLIMLSMGLKYEEKEKLLSNIKTYSDEQLQQLQAVFDEENKRKQDMLSTFFEEYPDLYPEFERFSKDHVSGIYREVESDELQEDEQKMNQLLATTY